MEEERRELDLQLVRKQGEIEDQFDVSAFLDSFRQISVIDLMNVDGIYDSQDGQTGSTGTRNRAFEDFKPMDMLREMKIRASDKTSDEISTDLMKMALIFLRRGTNVEKIKNKSNPEIREFLIMCTVTYGLVFKTSPGTPLKLSSKSLTLERVGIFMAKDLTRFCVSASAKGVIIECPITAKVSMVSKFPPAFYCPTFAGLIPINGIEADSIFNAYVMSMKIWFRVVNPNAQKAQTAEKVVSKQNIARKRTLFNEEKRRDAMTDAGFMQSGVWRAGIVADMSSLLEELTAVYQAMP